MNRDVREHFTRRGTPKIGYTQFEARAVANRDHMDAYLCEFCREWHVATKKRKPRGGW